MDKKDEGSEQSPNKWEQKTLEKLLMAGIQRTRNLLVVGAFFQTDVLWLFVYIDDSFYFRNDSAYPSFTSSCCAN